MSERPAAYLITGNPGSGKTTVADELKRRGLVAIDPDDDPELSYWEDARGARVLLSEGPAAPDATWLKTHRWVWSRERMEQRIREHDVDIVFVCGIALNIELFLDVFARIILLRIDAATQEERLTAHDVARPPGRSDAGRQEIRDGRDAFESQMLRLGALAIDATQQPRLVTDEILRTIKAA